MSVVAEVNHPVTVKVPLGCTMDDVVAQAGGTTVKDPVYFIGGPMMGRIGKGSDPVTKTTNAILVLPKTINRTEEDADFCYRFKTCSIYLLPV